MTGSIDVAVGLIPAAVAVHAPRVCTTVGGVEHRSSKIEIVTPRIVGINGKVPEASIPVERTKKIGGRPVETQLPVEQDIGHVRIATLPPHGIDIIDTGHSHQIIEVDFIDRLILLVRQVEFVGHLVGQEQGFVAGLFVTHRVSCGCECQQAHQGYHHLFHRCDVFRVRNVSCSRCKETHYFQAVQRFFPKWSGKIPKRREDDATDRSHRRSR